MKKGRQRGESMTGIIQSSNRRELPQTGFLRLPQVLELVPVSKTTWWAGVKAGRYPAGIKISPRVTAWRAEDLSALIGGQTFNVSR
jgi:predicted DNA-binding transcriptional regulator AlpA